ncbi:cysteine methyltransferase [Listeria monocytogenes]|nr:cysteine methyltransferase [Listeria monocytogenes]GAM94487.1 cysteine methyltransferase [Listeria monocytogenes]
MERSDRMLKQQKTSPVGDLFITIDEKWIRNISYDEPKNWELLEGTIIEKELFQALTIQLDDYFEGKREHFDLPVLLKGTDFQQKVWQALSEIPYGVVVSYKDIAISAGSPKAVQAVGQANRANPIPIIIPCHRCVKSNGELGGYNGADVDKKQYLLALEKGLSLS